MARIISMFSRAPPIDAYVYKRGAILSSRTSVIRSVPRDSKIFLRFYLSVREYALIAPVFGSTIVAGKHCCTLDFNRVILASNICKINFPIIFWWPTKFENFQGGGNNIPEQFYTTIFLQRLHKFIEKEKIYIYVKFIKFYYDEYFLEEIVSREK